MEEAINKRCLLCKAGDWGLCYDGYYGKCIHFKNDNTMKIYIAGKITGEPLEECIAKFAKAEQKLREAGANPVNPFKLGIPLTANRDEALPQCLKALKFCTAIFLLADWTDSIGARIELSDAKRLRLDEFYEEHNDYNHIADLVRIGIVG